MPRASCGIWLELGEYLLLKEFSSLEAVQRSEAAVRLPDCGAIPALDTASGHA